MSNEYGFFAAKDHDRRYSAEDFCALFRDFFTDGVYGRDTNGFAVSAQGDMSVSVGGGTAYVQGRWYRKSSSQVLEIGANDSGYGRYDEVVIRCDNEKREVYAAVREGIPSEEPEKPAPVRNYSVYEIVLAYIYIEAGAFEITQSEIEDTRGDSALCGWVTSAVDHIDTTGLFAQYKAQWELLKAACEQDAEGVIAAWDALDTVKTVNGIKPLDDGNIKLNMDNIYGGAVYPKYKIQTGVISSAEASHGSITFEKPFYETPCVFITALTTEGTTEGVGYYFHVAPTESGFYWHSYAGTTHPFQWVAIGDGVSLLIISQPADLSVTEGDAAVFAVEAKGAGLTYQWEEYAGTGWKAIDSSEARTAELSMTADGSRNGSKYRCTITDVYGNTAVSDEVLLTVIPPDLLCEFPLTADLNDISGRGVQLTYSGDTELTFAGGGLYLYYSLLKFDPDLLEGVNRFTVEFDVKIDSRGTSKNPQYRRVLSAYNTVWTFFEVGYIGASTTNKFTLSESTSTDIYSTSNAYADGNYHHVTIECSLLSRTFTAAIDGAETLTRTMASDSAVTALRFGDNSYGLNGYIKNLKVYKKA